MTVTYPQGFMAAGVVAGLKSSGKRDMALVVNLGPLDSAAAVFTSNRAQANPIIWSKEVLKDSQVTAVVWHPAPAGPGAHQVPASRARRTR